MENVTQMPQFRTQRTDDSALKEWREIFLKKPHILFPKRKVVVLQGDPIQSVFYIVSGLVEYTYIDDSGTEHIIDVLGPGNILCLQGFFGKLPASGSFIALTDATLAVVPAQEMKTLVRRNIDLAKELLEEMGRIVNGLVRQIQTYTVTAAERVEEIICIMAEENVRHNPAVKSALIQISQYDLARLSRTTRVTVTKALKDLKENNLVSTVYGGILVEDVKGLRNWINNQSFFKARSLAG